MPGVNTCVLARPHQAKTSPFSDGLAWQLDGAAPSHMCGVDPGRG